MSELDKYRFFEAPELIVFDLDFTLWHPEMYLMDGAPYKRCQKTGRVTDCSGEEVHLFDGAHLALHHLYSDSFFSNTRVAVASRTTYPHWARECLKLIHVKTSDVPMKDVLHYEAIYPRNKQEHFRQIQKESGIHFEKMLFFDNEYYNIEDVSKLGVKCFFCPDGLTTEDWYKGLDTYVEKSNPSIR